MSDLDELLKELHKYLKYPPCFGAANSLFNIAQKIKEIRAYEEADKAFEGCVKCLEICTGVDSLCFLLKVLIEWGDLYKDQHKYDKSMLIYERAVRILGVLLDGTPKNNNTTFYLLKNLASVYLELQCYDAAESLYKKALSIDDNGILRDHQLLANIYDSLHVVNQFRSGSLTQELSKPDMSSDVDFENFIKRLDLPQKAMDWAVMGDRYIEEFRLNEGIACFHKATEIDPNDPNLWLRKGNALLSIIDRQEYRRTYRNMSFWADPGLQDEAVKCFDTASRLNSLS